MTDRTYSLGIDLGTTFVAAAVARPTGVRMVTLGERYVIAPAVVHLDWNGSLITGDAAERRALGQPDRVRREVRRTLGDPEPVLVGNARFPATTLLGAQLRDVVQKVAVTEGGAPERIVLTHPAHWGPYRRDLLGEVACAAGLAPPELVSEPVAAARHALADKLDEGAIAAVYDLGGGTFEATVVRKRADGLEILGTPEGSEQLGGVDFDDAILAHVDQVAGGGLTGLDPRDVQTAAALVRLRQDCVVAKETLSVDTEAVIPVFLPGRHFEVRLTREAFEDMVRAPIEATVAALTRTVQSAGLGPSDLASVLLVGGSSRIPLVAQMVSQAFGRPIVDSVNPKHAVALGAASLAAASAPAVPSRDRYNGVGPAGVGDGIRAWQTAASVDATADEPADIPDTRQGPGHAVEVPERPAEPVARAGVTADARAAVPVPPPPAWAAAPAGGFAEPRAWGHVPIDECAPPPAFAPEARPATPAAEWDRPAGRDASEALDAPTEVLVLPRPQPDPSPPPRETPRPYLWMSGAFAVGAAIAVLILTLVFVLFPGRASDQTAPAAPPSTAGPAAPAPADPPGAVGTARH